MSSSPALSAPIKTAAGQGPSSSICSIAVDPSAQVSAFLLSICWERLLHPIFSEDVDMHIEVSSIHLLRSSRVLLQSASELYFIY